MNDFTKEELDTLRIGLTHLDEINPEGEIALQDKIQSMIDKYCEHEWLLKSPYEASLQCQKCKKEIE